MYNVDEFIAHLENFEYNAQNDLFVEAYDDLINAQRTILEINEDRLISNDTFTYIYIMNQLSNSPVDDEEYIIEYIKKLNKKFVNKYGVLNPKKEEELMFKLDYMQKYEKYTVEYSKNDKTGAETSNLTNRLLKMIKEFDASLDEEKIKKSKR